MLSVPDEHVPTLILLVLLGIASWTDMTRHRIPNLISLGGIAAGVALQVWFHGAGGLGAAAGGTAIGLGIMLPFYVMKGMGAGDVKLMGAVGAFLGPQSVLLAVAASLAAGSVLGAGILIARRGATVALHRYWATLRCLATTGKWVYIPPQENEVAAMRFPYALAIALGTGFSIWWFVSHNKPFSLSAVVI